MNNKIVRRISAGVLCFIMVLSLAFYSNEVSASGYADSYYNSRGVTITTSGIKANKENGRWYIEFAVNNQSTGNCDISFSEPKVRVNGYEFSNAYTPLQGERIGLGGKGTITLVISEGEFEDFLKEKNINYVENINNFEVSLKFFEVKGSGSIENTITIDYTSVPLHYVPVNSISFKQSEYILLPGYKYALKPRDMINISPNNATNQYFTVQSSNPSVASGVVSTIIIDSEHGLIPKKAGTSTLTAISHDGAKKGTCKIRVLGDGIYFINGKYYRVWNGGTMTSDYTFGKDVDQIITLDGSIPMYRLYNPNSGEHFYTANVIEAKGLAEIGWNYEAIAWFAPSSGTPVYRMYNPNVGDHHYTMNWAEVEMLKGAGWNYEGEAWKSGGSVKMLRAYNPNAVTGTHHYTTNRAEINMIVAAGWKDEGYGWYALR